MTEQSGLSALASTEIEKDLLEVSADLASPPHYTINQIKASFDQATENCSPGVLTTLATKQEVTDVIGLISKLVLHQRKFTFWIGLKKAKNECVVPALPLKGFKWTEDGSEESQMISWMVEPQDTCTTTRCAALRGEFHGSTVTSLGLIAVSCKSTFGFICKLRDGQTRQTSEDRKTTVKPAALEPVTPEPKLAVECWSTGLLELRCWGHPTMWRLIDNSPANFTTICQPCSNGFRKDTSGNCVDINECSSGVPCRHTCLNTEGSYRCICPDHDKNSTECTKTINDVVIMNPAGMPDFLIPVLVAVAVLVVADLMRRSKKRAMKKLEKMAMKNKDSQDSFTTANEKTAK
uniref:C-type lectin domain-containing protein n=1 Tax=Lates calcarifer TaxID=8187 RepID=A0A4W6FAP5_LATCA